MCIDLVRPLEGRNPVCAEEPAHGHILLLLLLHVFSCILIFLATGEWCRNFFFSGGGDRRKAESGEVAVSHPLPERWPGPAEKKTKKKHGLDCMLLFMWLNFPRCFFLFCMACIRCCHDNRAGPALRVGARVEIAQKPLSDLRWCHTGSVCSLHESTKQKHPTNPWDSAFCVVRIDAYCQHIFWYIWGIYGKKKKNNKIKWKKKKKSRYFWSREATCVSH